MVENRPIVSFISHLVLIIGVIIIAFPVWMTFVASTHDQTTMLRAPVPLLPGRHLFENYRQVLVEGFGRGFASPLDAVRGDERPPQPRLDFEHERLEVRLLGRAVRGHSNQ